MIIYYQIRVLIASLVQWHYNNSAQIIISSKHDDNITLIGQSFIIMLSQAHYKGIVIELQAYYDGIYIS